MDFDYLNISKQRSNLGFGISIKGRHSYRDLKLSQVFCFVEILLLGKEFKIFEDRILVTLPSPVNRQEQALELIPDT